MLHRNFLKFHSIQFIRLIQISEIFLSNSISMMRLSTSSPILSKIKIPLKVFVGNSSCFVHNYFSIPKMNWCSILKLNFGTSLEHFTKNYKKRLDRLGEFRKIQNENRFLTRLRTHHLWGVGEDSISVRWNEWKRSKNKFQIAKLKWTAFQCWTFFIQFWCSWWSRLIKNFQLI